MLWKLLFIAIGAALFAVVLGQTDMEEVLRHTVNVGWGALIIFALHFVSFTFDVYSWQITLRSAPLLDLRWLYRLWKIRMVGETFNQLIPAAGLGGEPLKAMLLKRHYGIDYKEGATSLILSQTMLVTSMVLFLMVGFALMLVSDAFPANYDRIAGLGLAGMAVCAVLIVWLPYLRPSSKVVKFLELSDTGRRIEKALFALRDVEGELVAFYSGNRVRFFWAAVMAFIPWVIGVVEIYVAAAFIGHPISFADAWVIEAAVQLVRSGAFFLPAGLGVQEGVFMLLIQAITGTPNLGVALAMVRRCREIVWILWGMLVGLGFPAVPKETAPKETSPEKAG